MEEANVNHAANKARVRYDPAQINEVGLIAAVKSAGYGAEMRYEHGHHGVEMDRQRREAEIVDYRNKFFTGLILSLPMLYFMLGSIPCQHCPLIFVQCRTRELLH